MCCIAALNVGVVGVLRVDVSFEIVLFGSKTWILLGSFRSRVGALAIPLATYDC